MHHPFLSPEGKPMPSGGHSSRSLGLIDAATLASVQRVYRVPLPAMFKLAWSGLGCQHFLGSRQIRWP